MKLNLCHNSEVTEESGFGNCNHSSPEQKKKKKKSSTWEKVGCEGGMSSVNCQRAAHQE